MVKRTMVMAFLVILLALGTTVSPRSSLDTTMKNIVQVIYTYSIKTVYGTECEGNMKGSGVLLGHDKILTCYHLLDANPPGVIKITYFGDGKPEVRTGDQVDILLFDEKKDLLYLQVKPAFDNGLTWLSVELPEAGDDIVIMGYPGIRLNPVRFYKFSINQYGIMVFPVYNGDSGGGVFNMKGELIGILKAILFLKEPYQQVTFVGYAIPLNLIKEFLGTETVR
jgi:hypothetical protein